MNWGAWAGSGMAERAGIERMERIGFGALKPAAGIAALGGLLGGLRAGVTSANLTASVILWERCDNSIFQYRVAFYKEVKGALRVYRCFGQPASSNWTGTQLKTSTSTVPPDLLFQYEISGVHWPEMGYPESGPY